MSVHHHQHLYWLAEFCLSSGEMLNTLTVIDWTAWGCNSPDYVHQRQVLHRDIVFTMRLFNSFMTASITATDGEQDEDHFSEWVTFLLISGINDWQWFVGFDKITSCNETKPLNSESGIIDSVVWKSFPQSEFKGGFRYRRFKFIWRFFYIEKVDEIDFLCLHLFFHSFIHLFSSTNGGMFMPGAGESGKMRQLTRPLMTVWTTFTKLTTDSGNRWEKSLEVKYSRVNPKTLHPANPDVKSQKDTILSQNFTMLIQNFTFKAKFREGKEVTPGITWFTEVCLRVYPVVCS